MGLGGKGAHPNHRSWAENEEDDGSGMGPEERYLTTWFGLNAVVGSACCPLCTAGRWEPSDQRLK